MPFIVFEGGECSGKTTQTGLLAAHISALGLPCTVTREPGGTPVGKALREMVLHGEPLDPIAEALLFSADRAHHVSRVIRPALERGEVVVCDRYVGSFLAYQGYGRGLDLRLLTGLCDTATGGLVPDMTFYLDAPVAVRHGRRTEDDNIGGLPPEFHERVHSGFRALAAEHGYTTIDAAQPIHDVHQTVVTQFFERRLTTPQ